MYRVHERTSAWVLTAVALACLACTSSETKSGEGDTGQSDTAQADTAVAAAETQQAPAAAGGAVQSEAVDAPLAVADIERWERGQRAEMEEVEKSLEKLKSAKTGMDSASAQLGAMEMSTIEAGARAAGLSVDRYRRIDDMIGRVLSTRMMGEATQKMYAGADTTGLPAEVRAKIREGRAQADSAFADPYKDLAPDVAAVIKRRAAELDTLRWGLVGARMGKPLKTGAKP